MLYEPPPAVTRLTVYRRLEVSEKDADIKMTYKSDDSSKFESSFGEVEVFLPQYDHCGSSDVGGLSRKIRLEQKSMRVKFDVGGQK